jgi:hypothetical protein
MNVRTVLYGCKTLSLTLNDEHRLRMCDNRFVRNAYGPKRDEVREAWRKLHNEELYSFHSSPNIIRPIKLGSVRWAGHVAHMGAKCIHFSRNI